MKNGKEICELLKSIRKKIADANGISYEPNVCHHEGDCLGTCPMCEKELLMLNNEINRLENSGFIINYDVLTDEEKNYLFRHSELQISPVDSPIEYREDEPLEGYPSYPDEILLGDPYDDEESEAGGIQFNELID